MSPSEIEIEITSFISRRFPGATDGPEPGGSLLDSGRIDSLGLLEIVTFVSERYGIELDDDDFLPENFVSPASIAALVVSRSAKSG